MEGVTPPIKRVVRMTAFAAALSIATAGASVLTVVACGGSDGTGSIGDSEGGTGNGEGGAGADGGCGDPNEPAEVFTTHPDAGCNLKLAGPRSGNVATSVARTGSEGVAWSTPGNARNVDCEFAKATVGDDQSTELLRVTDFGFSLPPAAKIMGVVVQVKRQAPEVGIADGNIELWLDGVPSDRPKLLASGWPRAIVGTHHYGQEIDTWGNDLTPELVAKPGFGVEIYAKRRQDDAGAGPKPANVESMRITIWYCE